VVIGGDEELAEAIAEAVILAPSNSAWPQQFTSERKRLLDALPGGFVAIEHFGSTAVPRLVAKPVIDMLAGVPAFDDIESLIDRLSVLGYHYPVEFNSTLSDRRWLMRQHRGRRTHHLHLVVFGSAIWSRGLHFRDVLRANPGIAAQYAIRKTELAAMYGSDREAYTQAKGVFIDSMLSAAA